MTIQAACIFAIHNIDIDIIMIIYDDGTVPAVLTAEYIDDI